MNPILEIYEPLYAKCPYGRFDLEYIRYRLIFEWALKNIPLKSSILEVGVGRGGLLQMFLAAKYKAEGTECVPYLLSHDLVPFSDKIHNLRCEELSQLETGSYDAVVSSDVLEHLADEATVTQALKDMARISRKFLVASIGLSDANAEGWIGVKFNLHALSHDPTWWRVKYAEVATIFSERLEWPSVFFFGTKKREATPKCTFPA